MGIYFSSIPTLDEYLDTPGNDFGKDIIPKMKEDGKVIMSYIYKGSWYDVGKINDLISLQLDLTRSNAPADIMDALVITKERQTRANIIGENAVATTSIFGDGIRIGQNAYINGCIIGRDISVGEGSRLESSIFNGNSWRHNDYNQITVGKNCNVQKLYADEDVTLGDNVKIGVSNLSIDEKIKAYTQIGLTHFNSEASPGDFYIVPNGELEGFVVLRSGIAIPNGFVG